MKILKPVGNAHVFLVIEESDTGAQYGLHLVLSDQRIKISSDPWANSEFDLQGTIQEKESFELCKGPSLNSEIPIQQEYGVYVE